ncbi:MAG: bifunctional 2-C-methyl-D-erythritol 4-phosphate cytidylyltransferase/2-C-methyl-D-erythritol 2,4-cyclodiphosphate synthase [Alphaproteobacteria bacterium]
MPAADTAALVVAAGRGARLPGEVPKQYRALAGRAVIAHTLAKLAAHPRVATVRAVIHADDRALWDAATAGLDLPPPVIGGATRQDSVRNGLEALAADGPARVLIHDAVRPLFTAALLDRVIGALDGGLAAIAALPVVDTIKRDDGAGNSAGTVARDGLWRAQTPQGFRFDAILAAHRAQAGHALTDDAAVAEAAGLAVALVPGEEANLKITTADDLARAEALLAAALETRVGQGFDVHAFGPGDHVMLCGVKVTHGSALTGHSDADVGLHAATDAILGALGAGDIGEHFPPSDPRWRGADSAAFLAHAMQLVQARGGSLAHLDVTLICEAPKVSPHRAAMRARLAAILGVAVERVSVKATTTEGLGFTGRREGIAAQAVATLRLPAGGM